MKRHVPFSGEERLRELMKIAARFEAKNYAIAMSEVRYVVAFYKFHKIYTYTPKFKIMHFYCSFPKFLLRFIHTPPPPHIVFFFCGFGNMTWSIRRSKVLNLSQISVRLSAENIPEDASVGFTVSKWNALVLCHAPTASSGCRFLVQVITMEFEYLLLSNAVVEASRRSFTRKLTHINNIMLFDL